MEQNAFARLEGRDFEFLMNKRRIVIGRNSKMGSVDVNMGATRFISRKHLEISMDGNKFFLLCRGKNGVFVNNTFQKREAKRVQLPYSCIIRFPSTQIKLVFSSLLDENGDVAEIRPSSPLPPSSAFQSPYITPVPSPSGTISAYNSCPASPRAMGNHSTRLPSFDLMARYASKLLSQQDEGRTTPDSEKGDQLNIQEEEEVEEEDEGEGEEEVVTTQPSAESSGGSSPTEQGDVNGGGVAVGDSGNNEEGAGEEGMISTNPDERIGKDGKKYTKPPYSYAQLIVQALLASKDKRQTLNSIYQFIANKYPYYRLEDKGWKNSIRHNLSLNQYFMKAAREREGLGFGKGGYWCMHPDYEDKLTSQAYVKRKKKGIPVFPSAGLMSKSAPSSPTHNPFIHEVKEAEGGFLIRQAPSVSSSHPFTLPSFLPHLASVSSHSLPPSPSRLPTNTTFPPTGLRFFAPMGAVHSPSTEALALETRRQRVEENNVDIPNKKPRLSSETDSMVKPSIQPPKSLLVTPTQQAVLAPQTGMTCFPLTQATPLRYPFVGMPVFAHSVVPQPFAPPMTIAENKDEEEKGES